MARRPPSLAEAASKELLMHWIRNKYDADKPEEQFIEICAVHGQTTDDVVRVFTLVLEGLPLTRLDVEVLNQIKHPTFLDLHPDTKAYRDAMSFMAFAGFGDADLRVEDTMFAFEMLDQKDKRALLEDLDLNSPDYADDANLLLELRNRILSPEFILTRELNLPPSKKAPPHSLPEHPVDIDSLLRTNTFREGKLRDERVGYLRTVVKAFTVLDRDQLKMLQEESQFHIDLAYDNAVALRKLMSDRGVKNIVTPRMVYLALSDTPDADPLTYAWSTKAAEEAEVYDDGAPKPQPTPLLLFYDHFQKKAKLAAKNDEFLRNVIARTEAMDIPAFSIKILAESLQALGSNVREDDLRRFLLYPHSERDLEKMWIADGKGWKPNPLSTFAKVAVLFDAPDELFPRPDRDPPVKIAPAAVETTVRPTLPPPDPYADAKAIFGDDFKPDELIKKALALVSSAKGQARITADLQAALKNPTDYLRRDGLPSLPHMLLMRAHLGDAYKDMSIDGVSAALQKTFDPKVVSYEPQPRTGYRAFLWTLLSDAQAKGNPIASYADLLAAYDFKQANGGSINPDREGADAMANRILGDVNNLFTRAASGDDLTGKRDAQLITKMVAVAGEIMNEENPKDVVLGAFLGRVNRPARRAAINVRQAFLKLTGG